jgi:hypothetical protein
MELLKFKLLGSEDILCMNHILMIAEVWTYPAILQKRERSQERKNYLPLIGAKLLRQIKRSPHNGAKIHVLWPITLHQMKALVMDAGGGVLEMIGHTTVSLVSAIFHLMNPKFGVVTLVCTIFPDTKPVIPVCLASVNGNK